MTAAARAAAILLTLYAPMSVAAQEAKFEEAPEGVIYGDSEPLYFEELIEVERPISQSEPQPFVVMRGLDKVSGRVTEIQAAVGDEISYGRLKIVVGDCRTPPSDQADDAYAFLSVVDPNQGERPVFSGWMFASSPALSAMDHQRYDLWVLSCATS
ncbi:MAG: DUF2155 domain-containing protein [Pseudomonadota bacterium]